MRKALICLTILTVLMTSLSSCYYDVEEELYGGPCDTTAVTYSATIKGLLTSYGCMGCHSGSGASGGVNLETHASLTSNINRVWGAINHHSGFEPMPQGGNKMNPCDLSKVKAWMDAGTPNN